MSEIEQIIIDKNKNKKIKEKPLKPLEQNENQKKKKISQISSLQNKIKEQNKHITSMQEYINILENKLKIKTENNNEPYQIEENPEELINKLKQEKEEILSQLKQEIILNDEQRNYIEILKQALESNIAKHGLTEKINFLKKKYYSKKNTEGDIANVILDISKLKENNDILIKEKEKNKNKINELNNQKEILEKNMTSYNKLNKEYNTLIESNNELQNEFLKLKNLYNEKEKDIIDLKEKYLESTRQNEFLSSENNNLKSLRKDNMNLAKSLSDLGIKFNQVSYDNNNLKDFQTRYEILLRENNEIKKVNQMLNDENLSVQNKLNNIEKYLADLENIEKENSDLKHCIDTSNKNLELLKNEKIKNENLYLDKIKNLTEEKNKLEKILNEKNSFNEEENKNKIQSYINDNKKLYDFNKKLAEDNQKFFVNHKYISNILYRILKFHIPNLNAKNIICEMINLNEKKIELDVNIIKNEKNLEKIIGRSDINFEEKTKMENNLINLKNEMNNLNKKINILEQNLKEYEI